MSLGTGGDTAEVIVALAGLDGTICCLPRAVGELGGAIVELRGTARERLGAGEQGSKPRVELTGAVVELGRAGIERPCVLDGGSQAGASRALRGGGADDLVVEGIYVLVETRSGSLRACLRRGDLSVRDSVRDVIDVSDLVGEVLDLGVVHALGDDERERALAEVVEQHVLALYRVHVLGQVREQIIVDPRVEVPEYRRDQQKNPNDEDWNAQLDDRFSKFVHTTPSRHSPGGIVCIF